MRQSRYLAIRLITFLFLLPVSMLAQPDPSWTEFFPAFRIVGNVYYVGSRGLALYLIATPEGHILINSNLESPPPQIREVSRSSAFTFPT
jgi:metallo-beta-lactamase class B